MTTTITCQELHQRLSAGAAPLVVDILPPEVYASRHLPGAANACVYEIVFLDEVAALAPDLATPLVLYDASGTTMAATTAREKLVAAGYRQVQLLTGGLAGWIDAGYPVEGNEPPEPVLQDGRYRLDPTASVLEWIGRNINNRHYGRIPFREGELVIAAGELLRGTIVLEMGGISDLDLQDDAYRQMLVNHLKSADFFDVHRYPLATITIRGWQPLPGATAGTPDHLVQGEVTIKDITRRLSFPATVTPQENGSVKAQAILAIDRTDWQINYGSGKLFEKLGMHLVHDRIDIELFIVAHRAE